MSSHADELRRAHEDFPEWNERVCERVAARRIEFMQGRDERWEAFVSHWEQEGDDEESFWGDPSAVIFLWYESEKESWADQTALPLAAMPYTPPGDLKPPSVLTRLRRDWRRATLEEREAFMREIVA